MEKMSYLPGVISSQNYISVCCIDVYTLLIKINLSTLPTFC